MNPRRIAVRPRVQIAILVVVFLAFALIGLTSFTNGNVLGKRDWPGIILGVVCLVGGALGAWRTLRTGVFIDASGIRIRGVDSRERRLSWSEVDSIVCEPIGNRAGIALYTPVIRLGDQREEIVVRPLASYSRVDAERKTELLLALSAGSIAPIASAPLPRTDVTPERVRHAASYPRMVLAARLYAGGFVWASVPATVVANSDLGAWWLLLCVPGVPAIVLGMVIARRSLRALEGEIAPGHPSQIASAAVIASVGDLLRRR